MSALLLYRVLLHDGSVHAGEYVGAQEGIMFLATGDEVIRIDQRQVAGVMVIERPSE